MKKISLLIFTILLLSCSNSDDDINIVLPASGELVFNILEYPEKDDIIGNIELPSSASNYEISILNQKPLNSFYIDNNSGDLKVNANNHFDYDLNKTITGKIKIELDGSESFIDVSINIDNEYRVFKGYIKLESQIELDLFAEKKYDEIEGGISLETKNIKNLDNLYSLKYSQGLSIMGTEIKNVNGLRNFIKVNQKPSNPPNSYSGVLILNNPKLENLHGLNNLKETGYLDINLNSNLINLDGLSNLTDCVLLYINSNEKLLNIDSLSQLKKPMGQVNIIDNKSLLDINGLQNIPSSTTVFIYSNDNLKSVLLTNLTQSSFFEIGINKSLNDLCGIKPFLNSNPDIVQFSIWANAYNPSRTQIINGECKN